MNLWDKILWKILNRKAWDGFVEIEISGRCNARCKYCCTGQGRHVTTVPYMKAEKFAAIMAHLKKIGGFRRGKWGKSDSIFLFNWTEPTLNPELDEILSILGSTIKWRPSPRIS
ncbi:MAG: radical SAM protein [Holosporales bacterium]|nr:radical SAM protein [Holosporales bacterium]